MQLVGLRHPSQLIGKVEQVLLQHGEVGLRRALGLPEVGQAHGLSVAQSLDALKAHQSVGGVVQTAIHPALLVGMDYQLVVANVAR